MGKSTPIANNIYSHRNASIAFIVLQFTIVDQYFDPIYQDFPRYAYFETRK